MQQANWHSLSPWAIISFSLTSLKHFLSNGYALVPILYTGWQQGFDSVWLPLALALTLIVIFAHGLLSWRKFRYRLTRGQLEVHSGALFKRKVELPIDRIQNVRLEQPFYFKPLRLGNLIVETAGSAKDEACLSAVTQAQAESLRRQLMKRADTDENAPTSAPPNSRLLVKKSLAKLALFGLYQNNFVWFAVIAGPVLSQLEGSQLMELGLTQVFDWHQQQLSGNLLLELGFLVGLLLLGYLLFSLISIVAALLKYAPTA
ncbi:PH domain-containing protein [Shewanella algae]|uniref:PH domain-containing protein n=1 Tax=Shewanella algae TaxID=38313 RepID=UPI003530F4E5